MEQNCGGLSALCAESSNRAVGQIQRYMGYVLEELAKADQTVKGVIIALEDDLRISRALKVTQNIDFYRYQVSFKLTKEALRSTR